MNKIRKRDGRVVDFDKEKIVKAVTAAFQSVEGTITDYAIEKANNIADYIYNLNENQENFLTIEDIQDLVEVGLMSTKKKNVARAYITYRNERTRERNKNSQIMREAGEKLQAKNIQNQNANVDEASFGGRVGEAGSVLTKTYALENCMSDLSRRRHLANEIYIHDLDSYAVGSHNCLSIPFDKLLANGFNTRQTDIRPAQSVSTAFQLLAVIFQLQSLQQFGGVSATHLDWTMVPYVRKSFKKALKKGFKYIARGDDAINQILSSDQEIGFNYPGLKDNYPRVYEFALDETVKEIYQAVEAMFHNLNTLQSRSGNQLPFTSVNFGTCTEPEGRAVIKAILEVGIKGIGKMHRTSIFPCTIFQCMKGVNRKLGDPNYDLFQLALKSTAQRLYPNYVNVDWSGNEGYDRNDPKTYTSTMGKCKLQLISNLLNSAKRCAA